MKHTLRLLSAILIFQSFSKANAQLTFREYPCNTSGFSFPWDIHVFKGKLFFGAYGNSGGHEFWSCNGSATSLVKDINPGNAISQPNFFMESDGKLFFNADDGVHGHELWVSDGTGVGTSMYKDLLTGAAGSNPVPLISYKNQLYFFMDEPTVGTRLWFTNSTIKGFASVKDVYFQSSNPTIFNGLLYFAGSETPYTYQSEPWFTDGTTSGKKLLDIYPGDTGSNPNSYFIFDNKLFFSANNKTNGFELWVSDGTTAGTKLFMDINPGPGHSSPFPLIEHEGKMFFDADDGVHGYELWVSDGTVSGTHMVKDINTLLDGPLISSDPYELTSYNGKLYFRAFSSSGGVELWCTDGTEAGTKQVKDINPGFNSSYPTQLTVYGSKLYFIAIASDTLGWQLFQSDGTDTGTVMITPASLPVRKDGAMDYPFLTLFDNKLFFAASYNKGYSQLWSIENKIVSIPEAGKDEGIKIYPNPSTGIIMLENIEPDSRITVTNTLGQVILSIRNTRSAQTIDLGSFANGVYYIKIGNDKTQTGMTRKILKIE